MPQVTRAILTTDGADQPSPSLHPSPSLRLTGAHCCPLLWAHVCPVDSCWNPGVRPPACAGANVHGSGAFLLPAAAGTGPVAPPARWLASVAKPRQRRREQGRRREETRCAENWKILKTWETGDGKSGNGRRKIGKIRKTWKEGEREAGLFSSLCQGSLSAVGSCRPSQMRTTSTRWVASLT